MDGSQQTPLDLVSKVPGPLLAANTYVRRLEDHQFRAHRAVQVQLAHALQRTSRRYGNEKDAIQPGEKVWLFTSRPSADQKLVIPYSGPWRVTKQRSDTLRTIRPEGDWCRQPKDITVSLNQLKRCYGKSCAPRKVDQQQLEDADDDAEGPLQNSWVTSAGAAADPTRNQEVGDVHAPSVRGKSKSAAGPPLAPRLFNHHRDTDDLAPSIVAHREHTNLVGPDMSGVAYHSSSRVATMTAPDLTAASMPHPDPSQSWKAPRLELQIEHQVLEEDALPPVSEVSRDHAFASSPPAPLGRTSSTPVTTPPTTNAVLSAKDTTHDTDDGLGGLQGQKQATLSASPPYSFRSGPGTLRRHAHHHLGTPILLSNNDHQFVHPIPWIPDSRSPQSRDGLRPSHQPVRRSLEPCSEGSIPETPATRERRTELPRGPREGRGTTEGTPATHPAAGDRPTANVKQWKRHSK